MKTFHDCLPCFVAQAVSALQRCGADDVAFEEAMRAVLAELGQIRLTDSPPATGRRIYGAIRRATGQADPYAAEKRRSNQLALELRAELRPRLDREADGFLGRLRLAAADLIIAKGQGNFETLSDIDGKGILVVLQVKCPLIARDVGQPVGRLVVQGRPSSRA